MIHFFAMKSICNGRERDVDCYKHVHKHRRRIVLITSNIRNVMSSIGVLRFIVGVFERATNEMWFSLVWFAFNAETNELYTVCIEDTSHEIRNSYGRLIMHIDSIWQNHNKRARTHKHTIQIQRARLIIIPDHCH